MTITVVSAAPIKVGGDLYKIVLALQDDTEKHINKYEIWVLNSVIQHTMKIDIYPPHKEVARYGIEFVKHRFDTTNFNTTERGAFISDISENGVYYGDPAIFPTLLKKFEVMIQTNVILPSNLHEWAKIESVKSKISLSELVRLGLQDIRQKSVFREHFKDLYIHNEKLHDIADAIFDREYKQKGNGYKSIYLAYALGKAYKTQEAIITLCQRGYGEDAAQLVRTLFDLMITTAYIFKDPSDRRVTRYLDFGWILKKNMYEHLLSKPASKAEVEKREAEARPGDLTIKIVMEQADKAQKLHNYKSPYEWSDKNLRDMAHQVGRLNAYNSVYRLLSQLEHSSTTTMNDYISINDTGFVVDVVRDSNWLAESLVASFDFYYHIIKQYNEYNEVGLDKELETLEDEYCNSIRGSTCSATMKLTAQRH